MILLDDGAFSMYDHISYLHQINLFYFCFVYYLKRDLNRNILLLSLWTKVRFRYITE